MAGEVSPDPKSKRKDLAHAFLWQKDKLYDLNSLVSPQSGWILEEAISINDRGQIVGAGTHWGKPTGYLMTPTE